MRTKVGLSLCLLPFLISACSEDLTHKADAAALGVHQSALKTRNLGEVGGSPWSETNSMVSSWDSPSGAANGLFGSAMVMGDFRLYAQDLLVSQAPLMTKGTIYGRYHTGTAQGLNTSVFAITRDSSELDTFGYAMVTGNFCEGSYISKRKGDLLIASMPTAGDNLEGGISIWGWNKAWKNIRDMKSGNPLELAGTALAVGDVDGDGKTDLVYASTPLDESWNYLPGKVSVMLDLCSKYGNLTADASIQADVEGTNFGSSVHVVSLDGSASAEIVVVDNLGGNAVNGAPTGSIHFYKLADGALVESRPALIGDTGASIESVAFSDIDGDGDLDLIVGQPMYSTTKKREGRVRTYTNDGAGKAFDPDVMAWSAVSDRSNAKFGTEVVIADLNADGVNDLIVGAPGYRANESSSDRARGQVYVYVGTQDGSIFSTEPYWTYISEVPTAINDEFGSHILAAQIDKTGWKDLIVAAPKASTSTTQVDNLGRVDIFTAGTGACYRADMCQVDGVCYAAGESADNLCAFCDPTKANFAMTSVVCEASDNACAVNTCNPETGTCEPVWVEDGTSCADTVCEGNALTAYACVSGVCSAQNTDCGNYRCSEDAVLACMTSCTSDADCYQGACLDGACTLPENGLPVIVLADYPEQVVVGSSLILDASQSYDTDGGDIWMSWWSSDVAWDLVDSSSTSSIELYAPDEPGIFSMHLLVTDDEGLSVARDILIEAVAAPAPSSKMRVSSPPAGATVSATDTLEVSGESEPETNVNVVMRAADGTEIAASCESITDTAGQWSCTLVDGAMTIPAGDYVITATTEVNGVPVSYDVDVHLSEPLSTDENGNLQGGACAMSPRSGMNAWWMLFAGIGLAWLPLRRRFIA